MSILSQKHKDYQFIQGTSEQGTSDDLISRQAVLSLLDSYVNGSIYFGYENVEDFKVKINKLPSVNPQEPKTEQFAKWVAREIFDDMWEYNKDTFAEIACRKLAKLGIVRAKGDEWELVEPQESEVIK